MELYVYCLGVVMILVAVIMNGVWCYFWWRYPKPGVIAGPPYIPPYDRDFDETHDSEIPMDDIEKRPPTPSTDIELLTPPKSHSRGSHTDV